MRLVALEKPHLFKSATGWWCCLKGFTLGFGETPAEAFQEWRRNNRGRV